jgi:hypothetical protein
MFSREFMNNLKVISMTAVAFEMITNAAGIRSFFDVIINLNRENQFNRVQQNQARTYFKDLFVNGTIELVEIRNLQIQIICL